MIVLSQTIRTVDLGIYHFLNGFAGDRVLYRLSSHAEGNQLLRGGIFLAFYWYQWFRVGPDQEKRRKAIVVIVFAAMLALVLARTIGFVAPFRIRPLFDPAVQHKYALPMFADYENWSSFPSDTATYFFALACGIAYLTRRLAIPVMLYTAAWICLPRMYFGIHYASDVVAGAAVGIAVAYLSLRTEWLWTSIAPRVLAAVDASPQAFYTTAFLASFEMSRLFEDIRGPARAVIHIARVGPHPEVVRVALMAFAALGLAATAAYMTPWRQTWAARFQKNLVGGDRGGLLQIGRLLLHRLPVRIGAFLGHGRRPVRSAR